MWKNVCIYSLKWNSCDTHTHTNKGVLWEKLMGFVIKGMGTFLKEFYKIEIKKSEKCEINFKNLRNLRLISEISEIWEKCQKSEEKNPQSIKYLN